MFFYTEVCHFCTWLRCNYVDFMAAIFATCLAVWCVFGTVVGLTFIIRAMWAAYLKGQL